MTTDTLAKLAAILTTTLALVGCEEPRGVGISRRMDSASEERFYTECLERAGGTASSEVVVTCGRKATSMEYERAAAAYYRDKFSQPEGGSNP